MVSRSSAIICSRMANFWILPGDGHRKAVNKSNVARDLIMRDLTAAELADFLSGRILAVAQLYPGAQFLAIVPVGHTDHLHVLDLRMPVQKFLDLAGIDVLSTADHHILDAANNIAISLF